MKILTSFSRIRSEPLAAWCRPFEIKLAKSRENEDFDVIFENPFRTVGSMGSYKNHRPSEPESDTKLNAQSHDYKEEPESTKRSLSPLNLQDNISQNRRQEIGHGLAAFARGGVRRSRTPPRAKAERAPARSALARRPSPAAASGVKANRILFFCIISRLIRAMQVYSEP